MATSSTITTIRTAKLFVLLVPKRRTTIASVAGGNINSGFVYKFHDYILGG
jgi:hypothetical protein